MKRNMRFCVMVYRKSISDVQPGVVIETSFRKKA